jgi:hypothetical protein
MIPVTKDKLEEARFFLAHLRHERRQHAYPNKPPSAHFRYYLHAFIVAARGVPFALQKEETEKYVAWRPLWEAQISEAEKRLLEPLLELTKDMRNSAAHGWRIEMTTRSEKVPIPMIPDPYQPRPHPAFLQFIQGDGAWTTRDDYFVELQGSAQEITAVCEQYVRFLERLVSDFLERHAE